MTTELKATEGMHWESGKTYTHSVGLSCAFRQWRAKDSHCRYLHGYALQVTLTFGAIRLDDRNWVMDFGGLKPIKAWLEETFDHKTLIAKDDPLLPDIEEFSELGCIDLVVVDHVGCEAFAKMIFDYVENWLDSQDDNFASLECVEVREHEGNFARYTRNR